MSMRIIWQKEEKMSKVKDVFKAIIKIFNNEYVKALYITIFIFLLIFGFALLIMAFPIILGIGIALFIFLSIYLIVLYTFN